VSNVAFIAARMGSERMPGKVLKELAGIPSLVHIFNILRQTKGLNDFIVVTTFLEEDNIIEDVCKRNSVKVFRGPVDNVLDRFRIAAETMKPDRIVRVTADDPLMDSEIIDKVIDEHCDGNYDYSSNIVERTYPRGMDTEVIEYDALENSWNCTSDKDDLEHVTLYIRRHPDLFKIHSVKKAGMPLDNLRLCLDTEEDFKLITEIYDNIYKGAPLRLNEVIEFLDKHPELKNLNSNILQKTIKGQIF
jgi:spore coat polysaccharide biosynthesis protein SpsF